MNKTVSILGSSGSIGTQSLEVARAHNIKVSALSVNNNIELLEKQIREFSPTIAAVFCEKSAKKLRENVKDTSTKIVTGMDGLCEVASEKNADTVITAVSGMIGLLPTIEAINAGKTIALANKETLVCAGEIVTNLAKEKSVKILPVDSEHSAIFQCINSDNHKNEIKKIILTASGGPFFGYKTENLKNITPQMALKHPNWNMGAKISIDSATLMNKGLELIEAVWLFDVKPSQIDILVHKQSIIHSMVEYCDNSVIAQLGTPDMKLPIQYALSFPNRVKNYSEPLDLTKINALTFSVPDQETFTLLPLCRKAIEIGGTMPAALNAANEEAVKLFLNNKISFLSIFKIIEEALKSHKVSYNYKIVDILLLETEMREKVLELSVTKEFKEMNY